MKDRTLRDAFEHVDEKTDDWLETKTSFKMQYIISDKPPTLYQISHAPEDLKIGDHILIYFDRIGMNVYFNNKIYDIKDMYKGVKELLSIINSKYKF